MRPHEQIAMGHVCNRWKWIIAEQPRKIDVIAACVFYEQSELWSWARDVNYRINDKSWLREAALHNATKKMNIQKLYPWFLQRKASIDLKKISSMELRKWTFGNYIRGFTKKSID